MPFFYVMIIFRMHKKVNVNVNVKKINYGQGKKL